MTERGILFSAAMVRALLDGTKTQTRRVVNVKNPDWIRRHVHPYKSDNNNGKVVYGWDGNAGDVLTCPYGQPGDRLWVRETWAPHPDFPETTHRGVYRADPECKYDVARWRPSIHMPRWASRILLEITGVRVERLQDISEADAVAEGISQHYAEGRRVSCRVAYAWLWESINGAGSWDANSWVWVVEFRRIA